MSNTERTTQIFFQFFEKLLQYAWECILKSPSSRADFNQISKVLPYKPQLIVWTGRQLLTLTRLITINKHLCYEQTRLTDLFKQQFCNLHQNTGYHFVKYSIEQRAVRVLVNICIISIFLRYQTLYHILLIQKVLVSNVPVSGSSVCNSQFNFPLMTSTPPKIRTRNCICGLKSNVLCLDAI